MQMTTKKGYFLRVGHDGGAKRLKVIKFTLKEVKVEEIKV